MALNKAVKELIVKAITQYGYDNPEWVFNYTTEQCRLKKVKYKVTEVKKEIEAQLLKGG